MKIIPPPPTRNGKIKQIIIASGAITFCAMMLLYAIKDFAPFGAKSLVCMDAHIQYLDFFSYYKDVLSGKNQIDYTFGKTLGGSNIAVFSYYLSSPFCLLLAFFKNSQLHSYFDLVVALKLSLASMTFAYFATHRFEQQIEKCEALFVLLSIGYGMCQYNIAQSSNIMWLDGVYMLPLILLQVSRIVRGENNKLAILVGLAILFNWYTAGIDCIFTGIWLLFEAALLWANQKMQWKRCAKAFFYYVVEMILGVMLSAILFLPTIGALKKSTRGSLHFEDLKNLGLLGELPSAFQNYTYGATSGLGSVALFCGSLTIILCIALFLNQNVTKRCKAVLGGGFACAILMFYWNPLYVAFSLFQWVSSYHYRYSYLGCFMLLFLALYSGTVLEQKKIKLLEIAGAYAIGLIMLFYVKPNNTRAHVYATALGMLIITVLFCTYQNAELSKRRKSILAWGLILTAMAEMQFNTSILMNQYSVNDNAAYQKYRQEKEEQIQWLKQKDESFYRVSDLEPYGMGDSGLTANYNEALSYGYASISGYTSSPDDIQREFLDRVGYPINGENMCITNTSILGVDSLLGMKYILSSKTIPGLKVKNDTNPKIIYENPYAFPIAFCYNQQREDANSDQNPFEYQNQLLCSMFGAEGRIYEKLNYRILSEGIAEEAALKIQVDCPEGDYIFYGNLPWNCYNDASVYVDGEFLTEYSRWLSPSVFMLYGAKKNCIVEVQANQYDFDMDNFQFYALNLQKLKQLAQQAQENEATVMEIKNGYVHANVQSATSDQHLFLSIPQDSGWTIMRNGVTVESELVGDCLYSIPLVDGENDVIMTYHVKYLKLGALISIIAVFTLAGSSAIKKKRSV